MKAYLILETGQVFTGQGFGGAADTMGELIFNTAMTGTTELITDPSRAGQILTLTYPLAGNVGVCQNDFQSDRPHVNALIVSELSDIYSNFRGEESLQAVLERFSIPGLQGIDTRSLVRLLRDNGSLRGLITRDPHKAEQPNDSLEALKAWSPPHPLSWTRQAKTQNPDGAKTVALLDTGVRQDVVDALCARNLRVQTYPCHTAAADILADKPGGIVLAGGPGNPEDYGEILPTVKALFDASLPMLALGLGHELLALATGAALRRLARGHHGANYPAADIAAHRVVITTQSHDYVVEEDSLDPAVCTVSHRNVNDGTVEGLRYAGRNIVSLEFHPDSAGTAEERKIIDRFADSMEVR